MLKNLIIIVAATMLLSGLYTQKMRLKKIC
jgi:hypothetical protein